LAHAEVSRAGATVAMGLEAAEVATSGMEVRVNGAAATPGQPLRDGDLVTVIPRIKGGSRPYCID
jgi:molybdopterin converting factor small subunit